jgi:hypothetical protein
VWNRPCNERQSGRGATLFGGARKKVGAGDGCARGSERRQESAFCARPYAALGKWPESRRNARDRLSVEWAALSCVRASEAQSSSSRTMQVRRTYERRRRPRWIRACVRRAVNHWSVKVERRNVSAGSAGSAVETRFGDTSCGTLECGPGEAAGRCGTYVHERTGRLTKHESGGPEVRPLSVSVPVPPTLRLRGPGHQGIGLLREAPERGLEDRVIIRTLLVASPPATPVSSTGARGRGGAGSGAGGQIAMQPWRTTVARGRASVGGRSAGTEALRADGIPAPVTIGCPRRAARTSHGSCAMPTTRRRPRRRKGS